ESFRQTGHATVELVALFGSILETDNKDVVTLFSFFRDQSRTRLLMDDCRDFHRGIDLLFFFLLVLCFCGGLLHSCANFFGFLFFLFDFLFSLTIPTSLPFFPAIALLLA